MLHALAQCGKQHVPFTYMQHNAPKHAYICITACLCMTAMCNCAADGVFQRPVAAFAWTQGRRAPASYCQANPADSKSVCWPIATASVHWQDTATGSRPSADPAQLVHCPCHRRVLLPCLHVTIVAASGQFKLSSGRNLFHQSHAIRTHYLTTTLVYICIGMTQSDHALFC